MFSFKAFNNLLKDVCGSLETGFPSSHFSKKIELSERSKKMYFFYLHVKRSIVISDYK